MHIVFSHIPLPQYMEYCRLYQPTIWNISLIGSLVSKQGTTLYPWQFKYVISAVLVRASDCAIHLSMLFREASFDLGNHGNVDIPCIREVSPQNTDSWSLKEKISPSWLRITVWPQSQAWPNESQFVNSVTIVHLKCNIVICNMWKNIFCFANKMKWLLK